MSVKHEKIIEKELEKNNACLGEDLIKVIIKYDSQCSESNARKIISRMANSGKIKSSKPIKFGNNQYAYFSKEKKCNYETLKDLIARKKPKLFRTIQAIKRDNGLITKHELINISGCILSGNGHNIKYEDIINDLNNLAMINQEKYKNIDFIYFKYIRDIKTKFDEKISELEKKSIAYNSIITWLKRINLILKEDTVYFCGNKNNYFYSKNSTTWDIFALSNTTGFCEKNTTATLVVIDFKFGQEYEEIDFDGFKERVEMCINSTRNETRKVLPIIVTNIISPYTLNKVKRNKYLILDLNSIVGSNFENIVNRFYKITKSFEKNNKLEHEELNIILNLMKTVNEENIGNLKGKLFEYLMYEVFEKIYDARNDRVIHSKVFKNKGETYECDVFIETETEVICIELKGYQKERIIYLGKYDKEIQEYPRDSVNWFLNRTVQYCKEIYKQTDKKVRFCYVTTAKFDEKVIQYFDCQKKNVPEKMKCYYNGESLIELLEKYRDKCKNEIDVIKTFYL